MSGGVGDVGGFSVGGGGGGAKHTSRFTPSGNGGDMVYVVPDKARVAAGEFMKACGLDPTPDAVGQMTEVFLPCLRIMCDRPWDPEGGTWRRSGRMGILGDVRKKFERLWERGWRHGKRHDDSGFDLINYIGFYMRSGPSHWGEWGNPASDPKE